MRTKSCEAATIQINAVEKRLVFGVLLGLVAILLLSTMVKEEFLGFVIALFVVALILKRKMEEKK